MKTKKKTTIKGARLRQSPKTPERLTFARHLAELRSRLYKLAFSLVLASIGLYTIQQKLVGLLLKPAKGQHFIYTTPGGGIDFLFRVCLYGAIVICLPILVYQVLRFIEPMIGYTATKYAIFCSFVSGVLAAIGIVFGYYVSLPAALHFLFHQFHTSQIQALVTIQSYLAFVTVYMMASALILQLPIWLLFINHIKPLSPRKLWQKERWVIAGLFIIVGIMNPSVNLLDQLLIIGPFLVLYQLTIVIIAVWNRQAGQKAKILNAIATENEAEKAPMPALLPSPAPSPAVAAPVINQPVHHKPKPSQLISDFKPLNRPVAQMSRQLRTEFRPGRRPVSRRLYYDIIPNRPSSTEAVG